MNDDKSAPEVEEDLGFLSGGRPATFDTMSLQMAKAGKDSSEDKKREGWQWGQEQACLYIYPPTHSSTAHWLLFAKHAKHATSTNQFALLDTRHNHPPPSLLITSISPATTAVIVLIATITATKSGTQSKLNATTNELYTHNGEHKK